MDILKKLNDIDIKDLKKIDLSNVKIFLVNSLGIIIIILLLLISVIGSWGFYSQFKKTSSEDKKRTYELKEKINLVSEYEEIKEKYDNFTASFPQKISKNKLNKEISSYAINNNVQILSLSPKDESVHKYHKVKRFKLKLSANSYKYLVTFINDIEKSPYALRIIQWSANNVQGGRSAKYLSSSSSKKTDQETIIEVEITIESIELLI